MDYEELRKTVTPGDLILFADPHPKSPKRNGFNQTGVVLPGEIVTFIRRYRAVELSLRAVLTMPSLVRRFTDPELTPKVATFFSHFRGQHRYIALGLCAIQARNYRVFDSLNIMPRFRRALSRQEHDATWQRVIRKLEPGDSIFVYEHKSFIDWIIARLDSGAWSHVATYVGGGELIESIPGEGICLRNIDAYNNCLIHIGVYRDSSATSEMIEKGIHELESMFYKPHRVPVAIVGNERAHQAQEARDAEERMNRILNPGYNLRGALLLGVRKIIARLFHGNGAYFVRGMTPNDFVFSGRLALIDYL